MNNLNHLGFTFALEEITRVLTRLIGTPVDPELALEELHALHQVRWFPGAPEGFSFQDLLYGAGIRFGADEPSVEQLKRCRAGMLELLHRINAAIQSEQQD